MLNFDGHFTLGTFLMFIPTNDDYSSNSYKSIEIVFHFASSIVSSTTDCVLFEYEICIHIASEFDITVDFFCEYN